MECQHIKLKKMLHQKIKPTTWYKIIRPKYFFKKYFSTSHSDPPNHHHHHVPLSGIQRGLLTAVSAITALMDPKRADMVAALGETTGLNALQKLRAQMKSNPTGSEILQDRPTITEESLNLNELRNLPTNTFGYAYVNWMDQYNYSPNGRPDVRYIEDEELSYIMSRYRQTHDFNHVLLDLPPTVLGEVVIKWFELAQTQLPMTFLSAMFGPLSVGPAEWKGLLQSGAFAWASKTGSNSELLLNVRFENHFDMDVKDVRELCKLPRDGAPDYIQKLIV